MATSQTYFYVFSQNNSGGYFVKDENVAPEIIIEATEEVLAMARLDEILSQKPEYTNFCPCCGTRYDSFDVDENHSFMDEGEHVTHCYECDHDFTYQADVSITFSTRRE